MENYLNTTLRNISWFKSAHDRKELDIKPPFQRNPVWVTRQKSYLIDTILNKFPIPEIYMQETVDEKLQKTLETRIAQAFSTVSERLEEVHKGLGEMKQLANDVDGLNKILSNVKLKGVLGEYQLEQILEQVLAPALYEKNAQTKENTRERVEFVVLLPGDDDGKVMLPIDSKFPSDSYRRLVLAFEENKEYLAASTFRFVDSNTTNEILKRIYDSAIETGETEIVDYILQPSLFKLMDSEDKA